MAFKMPTGKELDKMLDQLSEKDKCKIRQEFEEDVKKENEARKHNALHCENAGSRTC